MITEALKPIGQPDNAQMSQRVTGRDSASATMHVSKGVGNASNLPRRIFALIGYRLGTASLLNNIPLPLATSSSPIATDS